jgi:hypothetical protein
MNAQLCMPSDYPNFVSKSGGRPHAVWRGLIEYARGSSRCSTESHWNASCKCYSIIRVLLAGITNLPRTVYEIPRHNRDYVGNGTFAAFAR